MNILFIFGILASFSAVLTLQGIAGIILTIGMSVDANVIIFERIKEGLNKKKGLKQSVSDGFSIKGALSAIIDANITSFITGIILYVFGTGPIKGFALTLMIGIGTSLFTAIFITRLLIDGTTSKEKILHLIPRFRGGFKILISNSYASVKSPILFLEQLSSVEFFHR